ncbi:4'-phosphopantetheinyl transferase family protein [Nocardia sp. NPDC057663]|uniref:4'-phosphopantetheinyl transferase family protein n=1 Tax=Nocardia sp. NPDC057663 TaxID=3346201 RepID=UPI00366FF702
MSATALVRIGAYPTGEGKWLPGPPRPTIGSRDIDVWRVSLDGGCSRADWDALSAADRQRADRCADAKTTNDFVRAHGTLRRLLASYLLRWPPSVLRIALGRHGKPALAGNELTFNMTHTDGLAVIAVSGSLPVGVDAEATAGPVDVVSLSQRVLTPAEAALVDGDPTRFLRLWTGKESVLKCMGAGLTIPPDSIEIRTDSSGRQILVCRGQVLNRWQLTPLPLGPAFVGTVAFPTSARRIRLLRWEIRAESEHLPFESTNRSRRAAL